MDCEPWIDAELRHNALNYQKVAKLLNAAVQRVRDAGLRFMDHIHGYEFAKTGVKSGMNFLLEIFNPAFVELQVDTFCLEDAGVDCVSFF